MAKIAILHEVLGRSRGGVEAWIYHACEELISQGHTVVLFNTTDLPQDAAPQGVTITTLPKGAIYPSIFFLRSIYGYKNYFKDKLQEFDVVWARSFRMAWAASKVLSVDKVIYINAAPYAFYGYTPFIECLKREKGFLGPLRAVSNQLSYISAWYIEKSAIIKCTNVFLSVERKKQTIAFFRLTDRPGKYLVVPAGVNVSRFYPSEVKWDGQSPLKIITVGRLTKDKNIQCILQSIADLKSQGVKVELTVVGEGRYGAELEALADQLQVSNIVKFVGRQENVEDWYRSSHIFVLPSLYEGFGSVYVEAMASGLPCIALSSKSGKYSVASDEIIDHDVNGFLMSDNDPIELSKYILQLYNAPYKLIECGANARMKVLSKFSWDRMVSRLLDIWD